MKDRIVAKTVVGTLVSVVILVTGNTDLIFVWATVILFVIGIAYAEGCERL